MPIKKPFKEAPSPEGASRRTDRIYYNPYKEEMKPAMRWPSTTTAIDVYRTDPKTGKLESLAHKYDVGFGNQLDEASARQPIDPGMLHAIADANKITPALGVTPKEMVSLLAQEGRTDFGANDLNVEHFAHNKKAVDLYSKLKAMGYDEMQAGLPALMLEKKRVADKLDVPWQAAWQGMGTTETGRTHKDYLRELNLNTQNIKSNNPALDVFTREMSEPSKPRDLEDVNMRAWVARQKMVQSEREKMKATGASDEDTQRAFPDAPIPFPDDPNAGLYDLTQKYAVGGAVSKLAKMAQKMENLAEGVKAAKKTEMFIGPMAGGWDPKSHALALKMEDEGASPRTIWEQTMNWRTPQGSWAQEISDKDVEYDPTAMLENAKAKYKQQVGEFENRRKTFEEAWNIKNLYDNLVKQTPHDQFYVQDENGKTLYSVTGQPVQKEGVADQLYDLHQSLKKQAISDYANKTGQPVSERTEDLFRNTPVWRLMVEAQRKPSAEGLIRPSATTVRDLPMKDAIIATDLFASYPRLAGYSFNVHTPRQMGIADASFNPYSGDIKLSSGSLTPESSLLHELQHGVQQIEGWEGGTSPAAFTTNDPRIAKQLYLRNLGETMARATEARQNLSIPQRNALFPEDSFTLPMVQPSKVMEQMMWQGMPAEKKALIRKYVGENISELSNEHRRNRSFESSSVPLAYDPEKVQSIVESLKSEIYQGSHKPSGPDFGAPLHDMTKLYPDDIYSKDAVRFYGTGRDPETIKMDTDSIRKAQSFRNKPDAMVDIYRAVPNDPNINIINAGDWVTLNKDYAKLHGDSALYGDYKILSHKVKAKDLFTPADSIHEWGYFPDGTPQKFAIGGAVGKLTKMERALARVSEGLSPIAKGETNIIKDKGGNWLSGSNVNEFLTTPEDIATTLRHAGNPEPLNDWIDKKLVRYIKNDMGTAEDEVRKLFDQGITHTTELDDSLARNPVVLSRIRQNAGKPIEGVATTDLGKKWEVAADNQIFPIKAGSLLTPESKYEKAELKDTLKNNPWLTKVPPETPTYQLGPATHIRGADPLGFRHLVDELRSATIEGSTLPEHLRLDPKKLDKVTVPQAVQLVDKINKWREANKAEASLAIANNPATVLHKEYPEEGFKWVQLRKPLDPKVRLENPNALAEALRYEGDTMGHCVGGYCPAVESGESQIFSLRDRKGQPHVTIEVQRDDLTPEEYYDSGDMSDELQRRLDDKYLVQRGQTWNDIIAESPEYQEFNASIPPKIVQIKGKSNEAPIDKYIPFVQDFVRSREWSGVEDLENARLTSLEHDDYDDLGMAKMQLQQRMEEAGHVPDQEYFTEQELRDLMTKFGVEQKFAKGGAVKRLAAVAESCGCNAK